MNDDESVPDLQDENEGKFRVGDRVKFVHSWPGVIAEVIEDRGPLGVGGERLYRVRFRIDEWNELEPEYRESSLEFA